MDASETVANHALIARAGEIELELDRNFKGPTPLRDVLVMARQDAISAADKLFYCDARDPKIVETLQNEVRRFIDLVTYCRDIVNASTDAIHALTPEEHEELRQQIVEDGEA